MSPPSTPHILAYEDPEGRRAIGIDIVLHDGDKKVVHHSIGLEALDSLSKVLQSIFRLMVDALSLIDSIADPLGS